MSDQNRTFTQADVDSIVLQRLSEDRRRHGAELEQREKDLQAREFKFKLHEQAHANGLTKDLVDALNITDDESMKKAFDALKPYADAAKGSGVGGMDSAISNALTAAGVRNIKAVKALLDTGKLSLDGENIIGLKEQLDGIRRADAYLFTERDSDGQGGNPPPTFELSEDVQTRAAFGLKKG